MSGENKETKKEVSIDEMRKIAKLSRIKLEGEKLELMVKDFNQILEFVRQIENVDTENIKPMEHVLDHKNVRREDKEKESFHHDVIKNMAPSYEAGFFIVPKVIDA
ncbi:MAG: Asp-tRNA(Asn)/Glu-tRNA(Gln) amidotransferase subunit GatC [Spirochaetia bacterium]|nr:Asp-tRNA(Asn)/Glu-tRNA(Gln) amidotransferase subunit GatC [Spirochaetia bacterium]